MSDIVALIELVDTVTVEVPATQGLRGPEGPAGPAGAAVLTYTAGIALGGHRAVVADASGNAIYADRTVPSHAGIVIGITTGAASSGAAVSVQSGGELIEPTWAWTPEAVLYLGTNGLLTQAAPSSGFALVIGFAVTATKIVINIGQPIILE